MLNICLHKGWKNQWSVYEQECMIAIILSMIATSNTNKHSLLSRRPCNSKGAVQVYFCGSVFFNTHHSDTLCSYFAMFLSTEEVWSNMFSWEWIGCAAWLLLRFSPEKCSLISSQLAATQGWGSIDNQSLWQLVNCPGCWLGAPGALSTSAGKDKSLFLPPLGSFWRAAHPPRVNV